eukprot:1746636-Alexandrium_andersonii.AAC.1
MPAPALRDRRETPRPPAVTFGARGRAGRPRATTSSCCSRSSDCGATGRHLEGGPPLTASATPRCRGFHGA